MILPGCHVFCNVPFRFFRSFSAEWSCSFRYAPFTPPRIFCSSNRPHSLTPFRSVTFRSFASLSPLHFTLLHFGRSFRQLFFPKKTPLHSEKRASPAVYGYHHSSPQSQMSLKQKQISPILSNLPVKLPSFISSSFHPKKRSMQS